MSGRPHPKSQRPLHGPLQSFTLDAQIAQLHQEEAWQQGRRNAITLRKGQELNVMLLGMRSGDRLEEHSAPGPISLSVREGRVRFTAGEVTEEAGSETVLTCDAGVRHTVEALRDSVCLLTIGARVASEGASE